jgi:hypothetical protein
MKKSRPEVFGPVSFQGYVASHFGASKCFATAQHISIQSFAQLRPELVENNTMVLRLGSPAGERNTHFALVRAPATLRDFFIFDADVWHRSRFVGQ